MPVDINLDHITESISLDECYELLLQSKFDPTDQESFISVAPQLKKLSNNKTFLAEIMLEELKSHCRNQSIINHYTSQVIILKPSRSLSENRKPTAKKVNLGKFLPDFRQIEQLSSSNHVKTCLKFPFSRYGSYSRTRS